VSGLVDVVFIYKCFFKMAASLSICTVVEKRAVIRSVRPEDVKTSEIYRNMLAQYSEHCMPQKNLYEWVDRFKSGRASLDNEERTGCPSTSGTDDHRAEMDALIKENRRITTVTVSDGEVEGHATYVASIVTNFFADGVRSLVTRCTICVKKLGDYIKKSYTLLVPQVIVHEVINKFTVLFDGASYFAVDVILLNSSVFLMSSYFVKYTPHEMVYKISKARSYFMV
jgi:hypothetical protein